MPMHNIQVATDAQAPVADPTFQLRHYPTALIDIWHLRCGTRVTLRPVLPQDATLLGDLMRRLSGSARRNRFHGTVNDFSEAQLRQMSCVDYQRHLALVITTGQHGHEQVIAEARYFVDEPGDIAEFAITVDDRWLRRGLGARAMQALATAAAAAGLERLRGEVLAHNQPMLGLMQHCQFDCTPDDHDDSILHTQITLDRPLARMPITRRARWRRWLSWLGKSQKSTFKPAESIHA